MSQSATETLERSILDLDEATTFFEEADLWAVVVWNDEVNTFDNVIRALMEILHHSRARAQQLTWKVHRTGKAVVGVRPRQEAQRAVTAFHRRTIQATLDRA